MHKDYIVIGAGLSGLNIARKIQDAGLGSVIVVEKSRGVGGRMATRRTLETRFDHGAQFYKLRPEVFSLHAKWKEYNISKPWFVSEKGEHWCSSAGMTALAKNLAENLDVLLEKQIRTIQYDRSGWIIITDKNEEFLSHHLILSSPLPQSLNLLQEISSEKFFEQQSYVELKTITYTKALIGLITLEEKLSIDPSGHLEFSSSDFFSITDQSTKGVSEIPAFTVTMSAVFSEKYFDHPDEEVLATIIKTFSQHYPHAKIKGAELKKWRYCMPSSRYKDYFLEIAPQLYLIGDAFGGSSLLGAVRSSDALVEFLKK